MRLSAADARLGCKAVGFERFFVVVEHVRGDFVEG